MTYIEKRIAAEYTRLNKEALQEGISRAEYIRKNLHALIDRLGDHDLRCLWLFTKHYREGGDQQ